MKNFYYPLLLFVLIAPSTLAQNVGIGTASPSEKLEITGNMKTDRFIDRDDANYFVDPASSSNAAILNGNVGIGTTNPSRHFHMSANSSTFLKVESTSSGGGEVEIGAYSDGVARLKQNTNNPLMFRTNNIDRMTIDGSGNVGIGTTSPSEKLDVDGDVRIRGGELRFTDTDDFDDYIYGPANRDLNVRIRANDVSDNFSVQVDNGSSYVDEFHVNRSEVYIANRLGINDASPSVALDVNGSINLTGALQASGNSGSSNDVLVSTGSGLDWKDISTAGIGDNLGNHTATQTLNMANNPINNIGAGTRMNLGEGLEFDSQDLGTGNDGRVIRIKDSNTPNSPDGHLMFVSGDDNARLLELFDVGARFHTNVDMNNNDINSSGDITLDGNSDINLSSNSASNTDGNITNVNNLNVSSVNSNNGNSAIEFTQGITVGNSDGGNGNVIVETGRLGIGTTSPSEELDVNGQIRIRGGSPSSGKVLTASGSNGEATWEKPRKSFERENVDTDGTGWRKVAQINGSSGRGFGSVSLYTTGGSYNPNYTTIHWFHNWSSAADIWVHAGRGGNFWSEARITDDGSNAYIEVNFTSDVDNLFTITSEYGWRTASLFSGNLPSGGGNVRATASIGQMNVGNNLHVDFNGRVGIGTTSPSSALEVNGRINSNGISETSDKRLKKDVRTLENALGKIESLRGVSYLWRTNEYPDQAFDSDEQIGVVAQEVEKVLPQVVNTDEKGYKSVEYSHLVPVLIEAVKEQQDIINQQRSELSNQEQTIEKQNKKLSRHDKEIKAMKSAIKQLKAVNSSSAPAKATTH